MPTVEPPDWAEITSDIWSQTDDVTKGAFVTTDRRRKPKTEDDEDHIVGVLRYELYHDTKIARITYLGVVTRCRQQGLGAALVQELHRAAPDYLVDPGPVPSVDGKQFRTYLLNISGVPELAVPGAARS